MIKIKTVDSKEGKKTYWGILYWFDGDEPDPQSDNIEYFETEIDRDYEFASMIDDGEKVEDGGQTVTAG